MAKADKQKHKKIYYRRAVWGESGKSINIEKLLKDAHDLHTTVGSRTFEGNQGASIRGASFEPHKDGGFFLQIAAYTPEQPTSTIDKSRSKKHSTISAESPPEGKNYLDGEVFVFVRKNHIILCPSGSRENIVESYFYKILKKAGHTDVAETLDLNKVAKTSKINMIQNEGVKEISLGASLYEASRDYIESKEIDNNDPSIKGLIANFTEDVKRVFSKDKKLNEIDEKENLNVKITIKFDGNKAKRKNNPIDYGVSGKKRLAKTSDMLIREFEEDYDEDYSFKIVTGANNTITPEEIRVSDKKFIKTHGKSLDKRDAWDKLLEYYNELDTTGVLKQ